MTNVTLPADLAEKLVTSSVYASGELFDTYRWLRANNPLGVAEVEGFDPFWVVTKHADILEISRNNALYPSAVRGTTLTSQSGEARARAITGTPHLVRSLVQMDEPDHMKYRLLTQAWFMPANVKKREDDIRALARQAVDHFAALPGECDFVKDVALHYPLRVVMNILGVPEADFGRMLRLTQELFGASDPDTERFKAALSDEQFAQLLIGVVQDFTDYFETITADRRANPRDDLATLLANAEIDGAPLPPFERTGYYTIIATAGHDTTSSTAAAAMWALATVPGLLDRVRADLSLVPALVEESIRWATPVKTFMRSASADTELRGRQIKENDWLMLCYASGNRDEEVFPNPDTFDIDRKPNRQLAFGNGAHLCLGQHLARLEMRILYEELIPKLKSVSLAGEPRLSESFFVSGLKSLPIAFELN
ncbi:cytochrome P450 [Terricaulis silvestris]|uniref:Cytochrome P450-terp n=1 Tax=Terricaulis silvestris TaxID=2686094 RepID=A0A6I6MKW7_9CAUL|nr:cytochrome P450 [Terricaulis silvestris]QGZ95900.1 Cytochrome P450-terp [Terricaulis silvestris]